MAKHNVRAAPQQQKCRSQYGRARMANKMHPAPHAAAAAGSVQREDDDVIVEGLVELRSALPPQRMDSGSHGPEAHRMYSSGLLLAHRDISLRIARGAPGLEPDPAALAQAGAGLQAVALPLRFQ